MSPKAGTSTPSPPLETSHRPTRIAFRVHSQMKNAGAVDLAQGPGNESARVGNLLAYVLPVVITFSTPQADSFRSFLIKIS